jgi:crotonobetainyl-CoA:carnitine CoA-transferase CaiB-like acyl-CoA transferase
VDLTDERGASVGRVLADLGADVVLVEPPGGIRLRHAWPRFRGESLAFASAGANKRSITCDLETPAGRSEFRDLLGRADVWLDGTRPG